MQLLGVKIFVFFGFVVDIIQTELSPDGENVCLKTETLITEWEDAKELRTFNRKRIVPKCCDGYKEKNEQMTECLPVCLKACINGECVAPEVCDCFSGFFGATCGKACPEGLWGKNCVNKCNCSNHAKCDKTSGACDCEEGWTGDRCESPCQDGYYGYMCKMQCSCGDYSCDHKTGECLTTTAISTPSLLEVTTATASVSAKFFEAHRPREENKKLPKVSVSEILKITEVDAIVNVRGLTEITTTKGTTIIVPDNSKMIASEEMEFLGITAPSENTEEITHSELNQNKTLTEDVSTDEIMTTEVERETDIKLIHLRENKIKNNTNEIMKPEPTIISANTITNETALINSSGSEAVLNKIDTDNFINEKKGSSNKNTMLKTLHFLPGLSLFSSVSFLTFITVTMWLITKHRNKTRKTLAPAKKKNIEFHVEEQIKCPEENFFWSNNCTNNPVYLLDVDLNRTTPILETFKPLTPDKDGIPTEKEIR